MSKKAGILDQAAHQHKRPWGMTEQEVFQLMQAFTADKTCILEDDALTLCHWAQAHKRGAYALDLVLAGRVRVAVDGATVRLCPWR